MEILRFVSEILEIKHLTAELFLRKNIQSTWIFISYPPAYLPTSSIIGGTIIMVATTTTMTSTTVTNIFSTIKTKYTSIPIQNILTHINSISAVTNYCRYRIPSLQITAISCYSLPIWHHYYCPSDSHGISSTVIFFTLAISTADAMSNIQISFWFEINSPRCPI